MSLSSLIEQKNHGKGENTDLNTTLSLPYNVFQSFLPRVMKIRERNDKCEIHRDISKIYDKWNGVLYHFNF